MGVYEEVPFLAILEKRKDLLPEDPTRVGESLLNEVKSHLRMILFGRKRTLAPVPPAVFFLEANFVAFSPSSVLWEKLSHYYADLSLEAFRRDDPVLRKHYPRQGILRVHKFLSVKRPYEDLRLYHVEVRDGKVFLGEKEPYFRASLLYNDMLRWIEEKVRKIVLSGALDDLKDFAMKVLSPPGGKKRKGYSFIQKLINASGIPDGRKRILFYWLIPYWVTIEGKTPDEVLDLANEWISRQGGAKIYSSWILSEAENVRSKGIKPWSLQKVERIDPELVKLLRGLGVL